MGDSVTMTLKGITEFKRKLKSMTDAAAAESLLDVVDAGASKFMHGAKRRAPVDTGALRASIFMEVDEVLPTRASINVGPAVHYAIHQEYGTRLSKGHPYMRPTMDEDRLIIQRSMEIVLKSKLEGSK